MNGKELNKLKAYINEEPEKIETIMKTLHLAGFDDRVLDYLSDGLWSKRQKLMGLDLTELISYGRLTW